MLTKQLWLVAHLSHVQIVERVEAVVGTGHNVYIADHPTRCLTLGIDIHESFVAARSASVRYLENKILTFKALKDATAQQEEPRWLDSTIA